MWSKSENEILKIFDTNVDGISEEEAIRRLKNNGKNSIPKGKKITLVETIINQFKSPIVIILLLAAVFSIIIKSYADAGFIFAVIIINAVIGTYQEWNSEKNSEKLNNMIRINTKVIRDGKEKQIDSEDIVVGDIITLESGDKVPADLRIIFSNELAIDESILTGESIPKEKNSEILEEDTKLADRLNIAFAGSVVAKGRGKGIVIATGKNTEFGKVADKVLVSEETKSPLTLRMEKFVRQISVGFVCLAVIISIFLYLKGYGISEIFSTVVALTVSAIPEGLTIAMTIVLSISSTKMAKKNVIVKKLNAVESLGSCTRIATDKTGTLTANEQTAKKIVLPNNEIAYITGVGYNDLGEIEYEGNVSEGFKEQIQEIAKLGMENNEASLELENGKWKHYGDAIDIAFIALAYKAGISKKRNIIGMIPYESKNKYSAVLVKENDSNVIAVKGAVETIIEFCDDMEYSGQKIKLDKKAIVDQSNNLAKEGFRVIAIAKGLKESNDEFKEDDIKNMCFLGLVAFVDPIREDVIEAIQECKSAGIKISMITGDHKLTAEAIAKRLGIDDVYSRVTPMEKLEIVEKYKKNGDFIAVTGDGVNDTPALKAANIGVAMGSGTDIAKETGNMIIADDNFANIVKGVEEGRKAYNNIRKVIYLLLSTGFSEIILFVLSIILGLPIPLVAIQLLWLNLISNGIQGDALAFEKDTENVMKNKVKSTEEKIFNKLLIKEIAVSSITMAFIEFALYVYLIKIKNYDIVLVRTILLTLMVFIENLHIFNCRSERKSMFKIPINNNTFLIMSIIITSIIQIIIVTSQKLANFFKLTTLSINQILIAFLLSIPILIVMEIFRIKFHKGHSNHNIN